MAAAEPDARGHSLASLPGRDDARNRRQNLFGLLMSLSMLIETPGGFDFTGGVCRGRMMVAGFRETLVEHLPGPNSMIVGVN